MEELNQNGKRINNNEVEAIKGSKLCKTDLHTMLEYAREMWSRDKGNTRSIASEDRDFREFFGCSLLVACNLWQLLLDCSLLPDGVYIYHLLWSLMFLKVYSKERIMCTLAGVDKKTFRKWIWIFINAIVNLSPDIVSYFIVYFYQNVFLLTKQFVL